MLRVVSTASTTAVMTAGCIPRYGEPALPRTNTACQVAKLSQERGTSTFHIQQSVFHLPSAAAAAVGAGSHGQGS
jgi:hypothetical protein